MILMRRVDVAYVGLYKGESIWREQSDGLKAVGSEPWQQCAQNTFAVLSASSHIAGEQLNRDDQSWASARTFFYYF